MKKRFQSIPYKHRVAMTILIFALLPCIFLEIIYLKNLQEDQRQTALANYQNIVDADALLMSKNIIGLQSKMDYIRSSSSIRSFLIQLNSLSLVQSLDLISTSNEIAGSITADQKDLVVRWYLPLDVDSYGSYCYTLDLLAEEFTNDRSDSCFQTILALKNGDFLWQVRDVSRGLNNTGARETRLCLYTPLTNLNGSVCILEFSIPVSKTLDSESSSAIAGSLCAVFLNQGNEPVCFFINSAFDEKEAEAMIADIQQTGTLSGYDILSAPIPNVADSRVVLILPDFYVKNESRPQIITFIFLSLLVVLLLVSASYLTSHLLTKRIIYTFNTINDDLNHILNDSSSADYIEDDIGQISMRVRKLIQDTQEYYTRLEHYEAENLRMELELLQMRFNPHLLYNTLGAIRHQVKNLQARSSIDSLCHYYRIILNNGHLIIKIEDELEMIREYLSIEKFAYHLDNIVCDFDINEQLAQYTIIKHLLQPIVENALNHGIRPAGRDHNGILRISAVSEGDCICIRITDNGVGMSPEATEKLLMPPAANVAGHGYGIYNVQQRVQVYYGNEYGLKITSTIGEGTTVTLRIPAIPLGEVPEQAL